MSRFYRVAVIILLLRLLLGIFMLGDRYLHTWDERFHALVAKNLADDPLQPKLYANPIHDYDHRNWGGNEIWLSKPPLALWPMAGAIKLFGNNEIAIRIPSLLFSLLAVWLSILLGKTLFDERVGLLAGFFHAVHGLSLEFAAGIISSDHVDTLFALLVGGAFLFQVLFYKSQKNRFVIGTGVCVGLGFLTKYTMVLIPGAAIGLLWLLFPAKNWKNRLGNAALFTLTACLVVAPWMLYALSAFPVEMKYILEQTIAPAGEVIQEHAGAWWYYLEQIRIVFGELVYLPLIYLLVKFFKTSELKWQILSAYIFIPLILLSCLATKRDTYIMMLGSAFFVLNAQFCYALFRQKIRYLPKWLSYLIAVAVIVLAVRYGVERMKPLKPRWVIPTWKLELDQRVEDLRASERPFVLYEEPHYLEAMFYYDGLVAYPFPKPVN